MWLMSLLVWDVKRYWERKKKRQTRQTRKPWDIIDFLLVGLEWCAVCAVRWVLHTFVCKMWCEFIVKVYAYLGGCYLKSGKVVIVR